MFLMWSLPFYYSPLWYITQTGWKVSSSRELGPLINWLGSLLLTIRINTLKSICFIYYFISYFLLQELGVVWEKQGRWLSLSRPVLLLGTGLKACSIKMETIETSFLQIWRAILLWCSHLHNDDNVVISWGCWNFAGVSSISSQVTWARWDGKCYHRTANVIIGLHIYIYVVMECNNTCKISSL